MRGLNHVMNYVIMDFSCLLFSFMSFVVAELVNAFVLYKNTPDCNFAIFKVFVMSLIALFFYFKPYESVLLQISLWTSC